MSAAYFETCHSFNWPSSDNREPVLVLNPNAPIINRVGWAWGVAANLEMVTDLLLQHDDDEVSKLANYVNGQAQILAVMLNQLGEELQAAGGAK